MKKLTTAFTFLALAVLLVAPSADAQSTRTWVSSTGNDGNLCSRTAPCQTFAGALAKTTAGGEISVVDAGGYGAVTITKSVTINGDGTLASILTTTDGVVVNAGANDRVVLRNLSINGAGTGTHGIRFLAGKQLTVDKVSISGFTGRGIDMSQGNGSNLFVKDTHITNGSTGIFVTTTAGQALATIENVHLAGLANGLEVSANGNAMISDSVISGNSSNGILASSATAVIIAEDCQVIFNELTGVNASVAGSKIGISHSEIYYNATDVSLASGATVLTNLDNTVFGSNGGSNPFNASMRP